ncbi:hypothetical protein G6O69_36115 [Pseudenhygromyxa sp. WMMC2535]|uniref:hypothetical protein n=1 Tax=Pseudenhygromyxa sp. WMMC2535 TaxID=2712867 RepID=UPI0015528D4C|nr:hypothetical protein [Pseudenhygromyxa sp. WMMC2535]NVB43307.1 hypothetical protein [Pseudenhygromyxa sp. WMMC2535]
MQLLPAESSIELGEADLGETVIVSFIAGQLDDPLILGRTRREPVAKAEHADSPRCLEFDGHRVLLSAGESLTLRCGRASITLGADGRVAIEGRRISSKASGSHRIRGGTIN